MAWNGVCGMIGAKTGFKTAFTCSSWPATMSIPQMIQSAAIVAMSGKAS